MTPEQAAAYINGQAACLIAKVAGMVAANQMRAYRGESLEYFEHHFKAAVDESGCHPNAASIAFNESNNG